MKLNYKMILGGFVLGFFVVLFTMHGLAFSQGYRLESDSINFQFSVFAMFGGIISSCVLLEKEDVKKI